MSENKKRVKCSRCKNWTYRTSYENRGVLNLVGFYCRHCNSFYPKIGIKIGRDPLFQGLKQVSP